MCLVQVAVAPGGKLTDLFRALPGLPGKKREALQARGVEASTGRRQAHIRPTLAAAANPNQYPLRELGSVRTAMPCSAPP